MRYAAFASHMLTPKIVADAPRYLNGIKQREILLRGHQAVKIEHLGIVQNLVQSIDLSDNLIEHLGNFPRLTRTVSLLVTNNRIRTIDPQLGTKLPLLQSLSLSHNRIDSLAELRALLLLPKLEYFALDNNPISQHPYYRLYILWLAPQIRVLDFERVRDSERDQAKKLFGTLADPTELVASVEGKESTKMEAPKVATKLSEEEKQELRNKLASATTLAEIDEIEALLRAAT